MPSSLPALITRGRPEPMGALARDGGVNFAVLIWLSASEIHRDRGAARVRHLWPATGLAPSRHAVEMLLHTLLLVGRRFADAAFTPREVRFRHASPALLDEHRRLLGPDLRFSAEHDELVIDAGLLSLPLQHAEPALCEVLDRHLQALAERVPEEAPDLTTVFSQCVGNRLAIQSPGVNPRSGSWST